MNKREAEAVVDRLNILAEYYEKPKSEAQLTLYVQALADLPLEPVLAAMTAHVNVSPFFPKVSDIRSAVEGESGEHAELAWSALLKEIRAVGYTGMPDLTEGTAATVRALWGTWQNLCQSLPADGPELLGWAKQFKENYRLYANRDMRKFISGESAKLLP